MKVRKTTLLVLCAVAIACHPERQAATAIRTDLEAISPDSNGTYDSAAVARAWASVDSGIVSQLNQSRRIEEIQHWLTSLESNGRPDTESIERIPTLVATGTPPFGFSNTIGVLGTGSGRDSTLVAVVGWDSFSGPGHMALFTLRDGVWSRSFAYASDRKLWLQGRPLSTTEGWLMAMEIFVRGDGANARLRGWRVAEGRLHPLVVADTGELEAGDFVSPPDGIAIESPQYARAVQYGNPGPRVEERRTFTLRADTVHATIVEQNPWLSVVDRFYLAKDSGRTAAARTLVVTEGLRRALWHPGLLAAAARGDTTAGWGTVDLLGGDGERPIYLRVLVQRDREGRWRITKVAAGKEVAGTPIYPPLTP